MPAMVLNPVFSYSWSVVFAVFALSGFILGWTAQRGNYCFVNAMTSIFTVKSYERFGALLILFGLSALGAGILVGLGIIPASDQYYFNYFAGWYILVGSFIFGFGAALAGGCNLSMLYRAASGYVQNWIELFGMMIGTYIFAIGIWPFQLVTMEKGILSTTSGGYIEYVPYLLFHNVSDTSVLITAFIFGIPLIGIGLYLQRYTKMKWGRSGFGLPSLSAIKSFGNLPFPTVPSQKVKLSQEAKDMLLLRKPYGTNLSTIILALDMIMVFIIGAGYTFNYLVITSSDGGRFFEYLLMLGNVHLFLNTPWFNDSLPIVDPSVLMVVMLCVGAFLSSYLSGDFKIRIPREKKRLLIGFLGGVLVGIGVRMALGCNVGLMWTNFTQLGYDGIIFLFGMLGGVYLAVKVQERL
ncbi:transporter [Sulfolobus sp. A20]|uniref:YeeE/YedE family protein n=2 Tax=Sulfolobaceae TaxID=118883 RepID=UPI000845D36B|nr:YeeE/YedE family protein [Sulfolobus sp. A20]TRM75258.1 YeeE/YedE family protein [Sulfolobus sp. A20-N-F8]TRM79459.1 YeeE/YedE family protein [Sulfolobus sp. B5]TRM82371.1 YeeE/YedE family protein [Sulfolobus sp. D5]TRM88979.1 YeeE/YedE family protein [Sulfolobus sp. C3]TRM89335.1 YeeE/YedE family protein [Sulfolobus sp. E3]TRM98568.1 YeeE/YedE family protein [Sulfolobus sp. F1]